MANDATAASRRELKQSIAESRVPVVLTISTDEVEKLCQKNGGLRIEELLAPMSALESQVSIRSASSHYTTRGFRVRFVRASELEPRPLTTACKSLGTHSKPRAGTVRGVGGGLDP